MLNSGRSFFFEDQDSLLKFLISSIYTWNLSTIYKDTHVSSQLQVCVLVPLFAVKSSFFLKNTYVSVSSLCFCINYVVQESQYITRLLLCRHVILGDRQDLYMRQVNKKSITRDRVETVRSNYTIYLSYTCIWLM